MKPRSSVFASATSTTSGGARGATSGAGNPRVRFEIEFERTALMGALLGAFDCNVFAIENGLGVDIAARGNHVLIEGEEKAARCAQDVLTALYDRLAAGQEVDAGLIDSLIALSVQSVQSLESPESLPEESSASAAAKDSANPASWTIGPATSSLMIRTRRKDIVPRSPTQMRYMEALARAEVIFALGPAGTGKTYLAVAQAVAQFITGSVQRLILSRPAVEAGERLGFLPGDMREKIDPYLRPLYDALYDCLPAPQVERRIASGQIEIAPLAFMRGRTLADAFIILDEAQNTSIPQMKMFLTRFGLNSRMVICGDPRQVDLPLPSSSGLADAVDRLEGVEGIAVVRFGVADVVRHPVVGRIVRAYEGGGA